MSFSLPEAKRLAEGLIAQHLGETWSFAFDHAKRRAGACHFTKRRITLSRYFVPGASEHDVAQVVLHEIAHAQVGSDAGHGPAWKAAAQALGYEGKRTLDAPFAQAQASWVGACPAGHDHYRYRKPTRMVSCSLCAPRFDRRHLIAWRFVTPAERGRAR